MLQRIRGFFGQLVVYGLGDVSTAIVSLFLLPLFTDYLPPEAYGVLAMLLIIEAVTKVLFRWGVDTAFMRLYYDCADQLARQTLASTLFYFLLAINGTLLVAGALGATWLSTHLIGTPAYAVPVALTIANIFVAGFFFIPYQLLRIQQRQKTFLALTISRSAGTVIARVVLVVWASLGINGIVLADVMVTTGLAIAMIRWYAPLLRPVFSRDVLRQALHFGLPRIPHSLAQQVIGTFDRYFLRKLGALADVGLYAVGATFGLALKLFLSAFEAAWTPFFLGAMDEPDARRVYSTVSTYVVGVLVLLVAGLCAISTDLVHLFTNPKFHGAAIVTPWIALGVLFQGLYLVGSIGLVITKRTTFYPISTGLAAATNVLANVVLIPRYGMLGAAWANLAAYAVLAVATSAFSWHVYPIRYEWSRLIRIALAGALSYGAATLVTPASAVLGLLLRGSIVLAAYPLVLYVTGFYHAGELRLLKEIRDRGVARKRVRLPPSEIDQVEMAGEIIATPSEPLSDLTEEPSVTRDSRDRRH